MMNQRNGNKGAGDCLQIESKAPEQPEGMEEYPDGSECDTDQGEKRGHEHRSSLPMDGAVEAPDGGWGWVVLAATIMVLALTLAFPSCVGIFYTDLQREFQATNSQTSWVPSIMTSVLHAGGKALL